MASMAVVATTSSFFVCQSSVSRTRSGVGSTSSSPIFASQRRSFSSGGQALLGASRVGNVVRRSVDSLVVRATSSPEDSAEASKQIEEIVDDLKTKWAAVENKSTVALYAGGALVTLWFSATIIGAINSLPLLPKLFEFVGLGYTGWFVYRYLLFKSSRKELVSDIKELKAKITGAAGSITEKESLSEEI